MAQSRHSKNIKRFGLTIFAALSSLVVFSSKGTYAAGDVEIINNWNLSGNNGAVEKYQSIDPNVLKGREKLRLTYNLNGLCLLGNDASAIVFDQPSGGDWRFVSLSNYGKNCHTGEQTVDIPLSDFSGYNPEQTAGPFHVRFWHGSNFSINLSSVKLIGTETAPVSATKPDFEGFRISTAYKGQPALNTNNQISFNVESSTSLSDTIVDFEVYDTKGNKVFQKFFDHQNISAHVAKIYQVEWRPNETGQYKFKSGLFTNSWSNLYWNNDLATVGVLVQNPVITQPSNPVTAPSSGGTYTTANGKIYKNGQEIKLFGVSWFGAESGTFVQHGLWARNWKEMVGQIKNSGFNAVRVPFCPTTLRNVDVNSVDYSKNPDLVGLKSMDVLDKVVGELNSQQIYVMLDHHTPDCQAISDLWYTDSYSETQWINDLSFLANRYKNLEYFVGLDIKNEPKGKATWGTGNQSTDWNLAAQRAGKAVLSQNPNLLVFVQGVESNPTCSDNSIAHFWGGNFEPQKCTPLDSSVLPQNKVVFTPHVYGPDVYPQGYFYDSSFPGNMTGIWDKQFGFLQNSGKTLAIGEFGGKYGNGGDAKDVVWQDAFTNYLSSKGICNSFYWSWNPNSGDTGGILKDDWSSIWQNKLDMLKKYQSSCR